MISVDNVSKSFGGRSIFDSISFRVNSRERVGLVGRNGHGKTTLFRIVTGEEYADGGAVTIPRHYRIGHVTQSLDFSRNTVLDEGMTGLPEGEEDHYWKVEKVLSGLGFTKEDMTRPPGEFSGGFQVRLNLAKMLVSEPDMLLLDEPTNYLDITSIRWIERFLNNWPGEMMLITHDRSFMDKVVTHVVGLHRKKARKIEGNTGKYYVQIAQEEEIYEKTRLNDERKKKEVEQFITRFRAKARLAGLVQSRIKTLEKMEKKEKLSVDRNLEFSFRAIPFPGKNVMFVQDVSFFYEEEAPLIRDLHFYVGARDRICVVGQNGRGKTTLLKILAGALGPRQGEVSINPNVKTGYFEQTNISDLVDSRTVEEEILFSGEGIDNQKARNICGAMMFSGDAALKKISVLSGGEKSRVMLGKLLATPVNLLLLDEPTNHLDMESCDALLAAIDNFDGTVIMVTHNEMFLHALAERLIVFTSGGVEVFDGSYARFLEQKGWEEEGMASRGGRKVQALSRTIGTMSKKEIRQKRSRIISEKSRVLKPIQKKVDKLEADIEAREDERAALNSKMLEASLTGDGAEIADLSRKIHACQSTVDKLYEKLDVHASELDARNAEFEKMLSNLEAAEMKQARV